LFKLLVSCVSALESLVWDEEHAEIKRKNANSVCIIGVVLFTTLYRYY